MVRWHGEVKLRGLLVAPAGNPPKHAVIVDLDDGVENRSIGPELVYCLTATRPAVVVVNNDEAARRKLVVQVQQRVHGGVVQVAVHAKDCNPLNRRIRKRLVKPTLDEVGVVVQQAELAKVI